jgi:CTP:molybdopterin cytidylyltransferase MocA/HD superfamily phosphohydrolase YqeK
VITGHNAAEVTSALVNKDSKESVVIGLDELFCSPENPLLFVQNPDYDKTDMHKSIQLGLRALLESTRQIDAAFILPGDMPGISPKTFTALIQKWQKAKPPVLVPKYRGSRGHPLLISNACFECILDATENVGGLQESLKGFEWQEHEVDDPGIMLGANTPEDLSQLDSYLRKTRGVSDALAEDFFAANSTPFNVRAHTQAVAQVALRMATALNALGFGLDSRLCYSGGVLHDLARVEFDHSQVAADYLRAQGYDALAKVVGAHDRELKLEPTMFSEANIVFVADKMVKETTLVDIKHRYEGALTRFLPNSKIGALIQKDRENASVFLEHYVRLTGDTALLKGKSILKEKDSYASS